MTGRNQRQWVENALWWQVYPLGFLGAPIRERIADAPSRTLASLVPWLDYLVELGCNGLLLGPIFTAETHGYDTLDHFTIDERLGTIDDFYVLRDECHNRGLKICLDGVFNHVGRHHPWVSSRPDAISTSVFEGHESLVELNHTHPDVINLVVNTMTHWLDRGADAWRLDAAYSIAPDFWTKVLPRVRQHRPNAWFVGEMIHGDYAQYVSESGLDSITQYELWKSIWSSLREENFFELDWTLRRHNDFLDSFTPQTFVGNHDVTRIVSRIGADKAVLAMVILLTVGGIPSIYAGDEIALEGTKQERLGGDDEVRPTFADTPGQRNFDGEWMLALVKDLISIRRRNPWLTTAKTRTTTLDNKRLVYQIGDDAPITVSLDVSATPQATITQAGTTLFSFTGWHS